MNLDRFRKDIERLENEGQLLLLAMRLAVNPEQTKRLKLTEERLKTIPDFDRDYQRWYSEALACITQLLPARVSDFVAYYKPVKARKEISAENYTVSDYLKGLTVSLRSEKLVVPSAAIPAMQQQVQIVEACNRRLDSSLFDIKALAQADLFDNELDAARELNRKGFHRGAGAIAGVILEGHLSQICEQHEIQRPRNPSIGEMNDLLKKHEVVDVPTWRFIQRLGDIRNLCDHKKDEAPTKEIIEELIDGAEKVIKTVF